VLDGAPASPKISIRSRHSRRTVPIRCSIRRECGAHLVASPSTSSVPPRHQPSNQ
jgi:hypothetical protein